jgi:hypothetical protein
VQGTADTIQAMQAQFTTFQHSIDQLNQSLAELRQPIVPPPMQPADDFADDDSVHDNANLLGPNARGRGLGQHGRPPSILGARRVIPAEDDFLGKPKFSIPRFDGEGDVEDYLTWELKINTLWCLHAYTEDNKIKLASSKFNGYAMCWWDNILKQRRAARELPVSQWREMKEIMQARFVPTNYLHSVFDRLTQLKQGFLTVDAYNKEIELLMQRS